MNRIGIDLDGVVANFHKAFNQLLRQFGADIDPNHIPKTWNWATGDLGLPKELDRKAWEYVTARPAFWGTLECLEPATLKRLYDLALTTPVTFITTRNRTPDTQWISKQWLASHGFFGADVLITADKGAAARALDLTHFIDDKPENCLDVLKAMGTRCRVSIRRWPYNEWLLDPFVIPYGAVAEWMDGEQLG